MSHSNLRAGPVRGVCTGRAAPSLTMYSRATMQIRQSPRLCLRGGQGRGGAAQLRTASAPPQ